jgi:hypothetical protein
MAVNGRHLDTAEIALAAVNEVDKLHYITYIKDIPSEEGKNAELALYKRNVDEAEQILLQASPPLVYRAIKMNVRLFRWHRALELSVKYKTHTDTVLGYRYGMEQYSTELHYFFVPFITLLPFLLCFFGDSLYCALEKSILSHSARRRPTINFCDLPKLTSTGTKFKPRSSRKGRTKKTEVEVGVAIINDERNPNPFLSHLHLFPTSLLPPPPPLHIIELDTRICQNIYDANDKSILHS